MGKETDLFIKQVLLESKRWIEIWSIVSDLLFQTLFETSDLMMQ